MFETCVRTVRRPMISSSAISGFDRPSESRRSTSTSRGESNSSDPLPRAPRRSCSARAVPSIARSSPAKPCRIASLPRACEERDRRVLAALAKHRFGLAPLPVRDVVRHVDHVEGLGRVRPRRTGSSPVIRANSASMEALCASTIANGACSRPTASRQARDELLGALSSREVNGRLGAEVARSANTRMPLAARNPKQ